MSDARIFYHGTSANQWEQIKRLGLIPGAGKGADYWASNSLAGVLFGFDSIPATAHRNPSVFLSSSKATARMFAEYAAMANRSRPVIIEVKLDDSFRLTPDEKAPERSLDSIQWLRCECTIPPERLEKIPYTAQEYRADNAAARKAYIETYGREQAEQDGVL